MDDAECARIAFEAGINPHIKDDKGNTPMHYAIAHENKKLTRLLKEYDGEKDLKTLNNEGLTPFGLHIKYIEKKEKLRPPQKKETPINIDEVSDAICKCIKKHLSMLKDK